MGKKKKIHSNAESNETTLRKKYLTNDGYLVKLPNNEAFTWG
jgi:hypothetical protein